MQLPHIPCMSEIGRAHITKPEHQEQRTQSAPERWRAVALARVIGLGAAAKRKSRGSGPRAGHESDARLFLCGAIATC